METKTKKDFKAVDFMHKVREEMSTLYNTGQKRYFEEIKKAMTDLKTKRENAPVSCSILVRYFTLAFLSRLFI